jgi:HAD superfamily hydrolase (TIGR01509 family)
VAEGSGKREGNAAADLVARAYEAWNRADVDAFMALIAPEIEWRTAGVFLGLGADYRGREEVRRFWEEFHEPWERISIGNEEMLETGPDEIVVRVRFSGVGRDGIEADIAFGQHYVSRDGQLTRMTSYLTWEQATAAALPPEAVIFDNDGLLLDSESVWSRGEQHLFESRGLEFTIDHKRELVGTSAEIAAGILEQRLGEPGHAAEIMAELDELVMAELANGVDAMVGARELVTELRRSGIPLALVSNSPRAFIELALRTVEMADVFDVVVSAHEVAAPKPDPEPYLEACRRLGVEPGLRVIALEDSPTGVASARAAGLTVIGVPSIPGVELPEAHHAGASLEDTPVLQRLGLAE